MLTTLGLTVLAISLGCDAFAVAITAGMQGITARRLFRIAWHTGFFQFLMPIIGYGLGTGLAEVVGRISGLVGGIFLGVIALHMLIEGIRGFRGTHTPKSRDLTRGWSLIAISFATSIDALVVGVWLGMSGGELLFPCIVIGLTASIMATLGMLLGNFLSGKFGILANFFGGLALLILAIRMFF
ncbi:manganese efflux pump MntP family protein [bacterium]|nr:manganese efflux pump MntP family protein [bacterium]